MMMMMMMMNDVNTGNTQLCLPYYALKSHGPRQKPSLYNDVMEFPDPILVSSVRSTVKGSNVLIIAPH